MGTLFEFDDVWVQHEQTVVLAGVSVSFAEEGITAIVGPSGSGKSTLLRCCNRLEVPTAGVVRYRGRDVNELDPLQHRRRVAMVFQAPATFPGSALDNVRIAAPDLTRDRALELLDRVGLDQELADRSADRLSGGEAQRLVIARALATEPEVLLADEPTSALDPQATGRLERLVRALADAATPVLWVTHDRAQVQRLADHVVALRRGSVEWTGDRSQLELIPGSNDAE
jgi:putative ABC transport system ATP-binding protein